MPSRADGWLTAAVALVAFALFLASPVDQVGADACYTLLLSESLLQRGSPVLDRHFQPPLDRAQHPALGEGAYPYQVETVGGRVLHRYPPGSAILSLPLVAAMNALGLRASAADGSYRLGSEVRMQRLLAALISAALVALMFALAGSRLGRTGSLLVATSFALATPMWSTASRALWSHTWCALLLGAVIHLLARRPARPPPAVALATLLAWSFFTRPTAVASIVPVAAFVLLRHRALARNFLLAGAAWLLAFVAFNLATRSSLLPSYFRQGEVLARSDLLPGLLGNLVSPSRGLLVFVPLLGFVAFALARHRRDLRERELAGLALASVLLHIAITASYPMWWAGYAYGPRFLTEAMPWCALLGTLALAARQAAAGRAPIRHGRLEIAAGLLLLGAGIAVHARGALSSHTWRWNWVPRPLDSARLWDWREPQFLAGLVDPPPPRTAALLAPGARIRFGGEAASPFLHRGWSWGEGDHRWTDGTVAELVFALPAGPALNLRFEAFPYLVPGKLARQRVAVELNDAEIGHIELSRPRPVALRFELPLAALRPVNVLRFRLPEAESPATQARTADRRQLGLALRWLEVEPR